MQEIAIVLNRHGHLLENVGGLNYSEAETFLMKIPQTPVRFFATIMLDNESNTSNKTCPPIGWWFRVVDVQETPTVLLIEYATEFDPVFHADHMYFSLATQLLDERTYRPDRTGTGTMGVFGRQLRFDISKSVPALTTKRLAWKTVIRELLWFLRGDTDANKLQAQNVRIWDGNSSRSALDKLGLVHLREGDCGASYGFQWRHFGAEYKDCETDYSGQGMDQLAYVCRLLRDDPFSRRIIMSAWNPCDLNKTALPPCHSFVQFYVDAERGLSCHLTQRSCDVFLGLPFNIFSYAVLTHILALKHNMMPKDLVISIGDAHLYVNHTDAIKTQFERIPSAYSSPVLRLNPEIRSKTWEEINVEDFELFMYMHHSAIAAPMAV